MAPRFAAFVCSCATLSGCVTDEPEPTLGSSDGSGGSSPTSASDTSSQEDSTGEDTSSSDGGEQPFDCPAPAGGPTMHPGENVEAAQVWAASGSPHLIPYDFTIHAPVLVEACARVQIGGGVTLTIGDGGSLVADGNAEQPVVFERLEDEPWTTIRTLGGEVQLFYTTLDGGGAAGNGVPELTGALWLRAPSGTTAITDVARLHEVEIRGSEAAGLRLDGPASIAPDSQGLTITEGASHPLSASATVVGAIPEGQYDGNADDRIVLTTANTETISVDATIHDRGVPYLVGQPGQVGDLRVQASAGALAVLTIEPGVELQFQSAGVLTVDHATGDAPATGALVAVGTVERPVVFTSAAPQPAAGDWLGIYFGGTLDMVDALEHARIEYAGGASASGSNSCMYPGESINSAAIRIFGVPPGRFVTNSEIIASAAHGIDRGWRADFVVDFAESVTFDVQRCTQTTPRKADGTCPDRVPCP